MKGHYFINDKFIVTHNLSYRSKLSERDKELLEKVKTQIIESIKSGNSLEGSIFSEVCKAPEMPESRMFGLGIENAFHLGLKELLCEGKVVQLNDRQYHVPTTECEKSLTKRLTVALQHYKPDG